MVEGLLKLTSTRPKLITALMSIGTYQTPYESDFVGREMANWCPWFLKIEQNCIVIYRGSNVENTLNFWNISKVYAILVFVRLDKCFIKKAIIKHNQVKNIALSLQLELVGGQIGHCKETSEPINAMVNLRWFKKIGSQIGLLLINLLVFCQKTF